MWTTLTENTFNQLYYHISCLERENFIFSSSFGEPYAGKGPVGPAYLSLDQLLQMGWFYPVSLKKQSRMSPFLTVVV